MNDLPVICLKSTVSLKDGMVMAEITIEGDISGLGALLEGAMYQNDLLAALVVGCAIFYCDRKKKDIVEVRDMYRSTKEKEK